MNKIHRYYVFLIVFQLIIIAYGGRCQGQGNNSPEPMTYGQTYAIQIAASKTFIDPEFFKNKFKLVEEVRYFRKDGWYKYIMGSYKTESLANKKRSQLDFNCFVTAVPVTVKSTRVQQKPDKNRVVAAPKPVETAPLPDTSIYSQPLQNTITAIPDARQLYIQKIRVADSAFSFLKDLILARKLYQEAIEILPGKNYPQDQIIEIDKLLIQNQPQPWFSNISLKILIIGCSLVVLLILGFMLIRRFRNRHHNSKRKKASKRFHEPKTKFVFGDTTSEPAGFTDTKADYQRQMLIHEILQLYPYLADDISEITGSKSCNYKIMHAEMVSCLNSSNEILRMETELAWIRLHDEDPFSFLSILHQDFEPWEQLHVFEMVKRNKVPVPDFSRWLGSNNDSVVNFCQRMMVVFKQGDDHSGEIDVPVMDEADNDQADFLGKPGEDLQSAAYQILINRMKS